jgi:transaldolase
MLTKFFFDVADVDYIKDKWRKIKKYVDPKSVVGVTTNPGIWDKAGIKTLKEMESRLIDLSKLITEIRGDNEGVVYTQPPYSRMPLFEICKFIEYIKEQNDGHTKIGCKLPPFLNVLKEVSKWKEKYGVDFNVTGLSECSTAIMAASYDIKYISVIPGRMEEAGIDAKLQINFIRHALLNTEIITGAMRTVDCLSWVCQYGTVPTIGTRVWDKIFDELGAEKFTTLWYPQLDLFPSDFSPQIDISMINLSLGFFDQMDKLGAYIYKEFQDQL